MHKRQKKKIKIKFTELFCVHLDFYCVMRRRKEREKKKKKDRIKHWMNKRKGLKKMAVLKHMTKNGGQPPRLKTIFTECVLRYR